jgi:hypothetical protein
MYIKRLNKIMLATCSLVVAACATPPKPAPEVPSIVGNLMAQSKYRNETQLQVMGLANDPEKAIKKSPEGNITIYWSGDAAKLLPEIALKIKKDFSVQGKPVLPLPVALDVKSASLQQVLESIADQINSRADIILENNSVILEYRIKTK